MDIGDNTRGLVERAAADEPHPGVSVLAEDRHLADWTTEDPLFAAVVAKHVDRLRGACEQLYTIGLDQQVDYEGASGLPLAVQAVTAVREERIGRKPVANRSAGAATLMWNAHDLLLGDKGRSLDCTVRLELAFLASSESGQVYTRLREGRAAWPDEAFENDVAELLGVRAKVITLPALRADESETRDDALVAAKDRADMAILARLG